PASVLLLVLPRSRAHRPLPSFPTRRSSDLFAQIIQNIAGNAVERIMLRFSLFDHYILNTAHTVGIKESTGHINDFPALETHDERSEEHTSELHSRFAPVCRLLLDQTSLPS